MWLGRIALTKTPVVYTVHNLQPHEKLDSLSLKAHKLLMGLVTLKVYINESQENPPDGVTILHGMQPNRQSAQVHDNFDKGRLLFFGGLKEYKGIEELVSAFAKLDPEGFNLTVAGLGAPSINQFLASASSTLPNLEFIEGHVPEEKLRQLIDAANLIVLPYKYFYNSGVAFAALERGKRVLLPRSLSSESLVTEFGNSKVRIVSLSKQYLSEILELRGHVKNSNFKNFLRL
jgi:beta-1,4-mannosyltransferase